MLTRAGVVNNGQTAVAATLNAIVYWKLPVYLARYHMKLKLPSRGKCSYLSRFPYLIIIFVLCIAQVCAVTFRAGLPQIIAQSMLTFIAEVWKTSYVLNYA